MNCPHCGTHIDEHEATPCFNAWVAEDVMGWLKTDQRRIDHQNWLEYPQEWYLKPNGDIENVTNIPEYSTDIAAAWEVVEKLRSRQMPIVLHGDEWHSGGDWQVTIYNLREHMGVLGRGAHKVTVLGRGDPSAPLAICRAAIKATSK